MDFREDEEAVLHLNRGTGFRTVWLYVFVKIWRTIYTKTDTFTAYKLYLNKKDEANKTDYIYIEFHFIATT